MPQEEGHLAPGGGRCCPSTERLNCCLTRLSSEEHRLRLTPAWLRLLFFWPMPCVLTSACPRPSLGKCGGGVWQWRSFGLPRSSSLRDTKAFGVSCACRTSLTCCSQVYRLRYCCFQSGLQRTKVSGLPRYRGE